jgi:hypothetical protein
MGGFKMKRKKNTDGKNREIIADENTYPDKNTIALIDLIANIIVDKTLAQSEKREDPHARTDPDI